MGRFRKYHTKPVRQNRSGDRFGRKIGPTNQFWLPKSVHITGPILAAKIGPFAKNGPHAKLKVYTCNEKFGPGKKRSRRTIFSRQNLVRGTKFGYQNRSGPTKNGPV